jgi:putative acetyltransferase
VEIRTEEMNDYADVFQLNYLAFDNREDESKLVEKIRVSESFVPELSIVAEENDQVVGHALFSKAVVVDGENKHDVIVLAPIAVLPSQQKKGLGGLLIHEGLKRSVELGYDYVFLIGHPTYYPKFGFKPARSLGFELKQFDVPDEVFMVYELAQGNRKNLQGELMYPESFFE